MNTRDIAVAMGFKAMQFNFVASSNDVALALWKKLGFDVVGTLPRALTIRHWDWLTPLLCINGSLTKKPKQAQKRSTK